MCVYCLLHDIHDNFSQNTKQDTVLLNFRSKSNVIVLFERKYNVQNGDIETNI